MMRNRRFPLAISLLVILALVVTVIGGCSSQPAAPAKEAAKAGSGAAKKSYLVGYNPCSFQQPWEEGLAAANQRIKDIEQQNGVAIEMITLAQSAHVELGQASQIIDDLISRKADVILSCVMDPASWPAFSKKAGAAGIPFGAIIENTKFPGHDLNFGINNDNLAGGRLIGEAVSKALGGKGNVAIMHGFTANQTDKDRTAGAKEVFAKSAGIKVIAEGQGDFQREPAARVAQDWAERYRDQIDAVVAINDEMALGVQRVMKTAMPNRKVVVTGFDGTEEGVASVNSGVLDAVVYMDFTNYGKLMIDAAWSVVQGKPVQHPIMIPYPLVDKSNALGILKRIQNTKAGIRQWDPSSKLLEVVPLPK